MKKIILFSFSTMLIFVSCKKTITVSQIDTPLPDKEIRISFPIEPQDVNFTKGVQLYPSTTYIYDFDKRDYPGVDSITFNFDGRINAGNAFRLYNVTDSSLVTGSIITKSYYYAGELHSMNIYNSLPDKKITLAVRYDTPKEWTGSCYIQSVFLKLRRD